MNNLQNNKMNNKPTKSGPTASKIPTSGRDSGTHSRSSSVSNLTTASDIHSEIGDVASDNPEDFKLDERVWLNGTKPGYIKFIGKTQFAPGTWAGVLLDEPHGKNDGSVAGVKYFSCEPLRGVFARPAKLTRTPGNISGIGDSTMAGALTPKSSAIPSSRASVCSNMSGTSPGRCSRLRVGERITVSSLNGVKAGTLRYIGETDFAKGEWAGIELDEPSGKNDGSVAGKRYFTCQMKYGLFSPMHKVSRAGGTTSVSRPGSVRGTPLMRSSSRDSLSSSISNSSRASRVKLGVTSLTQKNASGGFIANASKALQEALKEKDQHIEQLLKERDLDRAEFAKVTSHFEEIETKTSDLQRKQKETESDKRKSEELLVSVQRKLEDIQFQLEEEKIVRSDFEMQLQEKSKILKRIEEFIGVEANEKFLNIKEILSGQEALSEIGDVSKPSSDSDRLEKKIAELESTVKQLLAEKQEVNNQLTELQKCSGEISTKNETLIAHLSTAVQEKDDMITNLKNELNSNIEKVTQLIEDNRTLSEQMLLKEEQAKGHADDVIKELGEKINALNEELKTKSSQLSEISSSNQEKDSKISTLDLCMSEQTATLLQLQNEHKHVSEALKQKESELGGNVALQKSLEETIVTLKSQLESDSDEKQKQINLLDEEIKTKSCQLNDFLSSIEEKENLISSLQQNFDSQAASLSQLQNEKKELSENLKQKDLELEEKATKQKSLEEQIAALTSQTDFTIADTQKKMLDLVKEIENLTNNVQEKEDQLLKTHSELASTKSELEKHNETIQQLSEKLQQTELSSNSALKDSYEKINSLEKQLKEIVLEKDDMKSGFEKEIEDFRIAIKGKEEEVQAKNDIIAQHESQISLLTEKSKKNEEDCCLLKNEIALLTENSKQFSIEKEDFETYRKEKEEEMRILKDAVKNKENEVENKNSIIVQNESQISVLTEKSKKNEDDCCSLKKEVDVLAEKNKEISSEKEELEKSLKIKDETVVSLTKQVENLKLSTDKNHLDLEEKEKKLLSLEDLINVKEEENNQLNSKLQLAEQKVEMLNKDSSDHVMSLQKELSKIKEETTSTKTHLEQDLSKLRQEKEKLLVSISEKEKTLLEKDESLTSIEKILKEKETEISCLSAEKSDLLQNVLNYKNDSEEIKKKYEELSNTLAEYQKSLSDREQELSILKANSEKMFNTLSDKEKTLLEKEETLSSLQNKLKERESEISDLSSQNADLLKNIAKFSSDIEAERRIHDEKFSNSVSDLDQKLKERDLCIEELQNQLKKHLEQVEHKTKDLNEKENEINNLRTMVKEKNSQFEELNKLVELSEQQLALLKDQNLKNESLLQNKESLMNEFKIDLEKQLHAKEQSFKEETVKLESMIKSKNEEMKEKETEISTLVNDIQGKKTLVESLQVELEAAKAEKEKMLNDSGSIHQEFKNRILDLEEKYSNLLEEKEKIAQEELQTRDAKKNLELVRDSLIQEKSAQEEIVKDREAKIEALQTEVNRMQLEFALHKEELQKKLDINKVEIEAALELKTQLELQHRVLEELQQQLHDSEENCKGLEAQTKALSALTSEKNELQAQMEEIQKINKEKTEMITNIKEMNSSLEEQLKNNKNLMSQKEIEISRLKDQLKQKSDIKPDNLNSLKSLEEENTALKNKIAVLELAKSEKNPDMSAVTSQLLSPVDDEEKEFLQSQVDFLNSIIVDMKQKNEELTRQLEIQNTCWDESDVNLNETKKAIAPRLFCDICDMFDLHETDDCPKQESFADEEVPQLRRPGTRKMEERPYCNNCEVFGHWTLDCDEQEEF